MVRCEANIIHVSGRTATAEGRIVDAKGTLYAYGTTTCIIFRPSPHLSGWASVATLVAFARCFVG